MKNVSVIPAHLLIAHEDIALLCDPAALANHSVLIIAVYLQGENTLMSIFTSYLYTYVIQSSRGTTKLH